MQTPAWFLFASLILNGLLLGVAGHRWLTAQTHAIPTASPQSSEASSVANPTAGKEVLNDAPNSIDGSDASDFTRSLWTRIDSEDYDVLVKNLRDAGFPPRLVRSLVFDLVQARGEIARAAIQGKSPDLPYWKTTQYFPDDPVLKARIREINEAGNNVLAKHIFDPAIVKEEEFSAAYLRQRYGDLPDETLQTRIKIQHDSYELISEVTKASRNGADRQPTPEERAKIALIKAERDKDLQTLLTPEQFEQYELRSSYTAATLRSKLEVFHPSETEFKAIFRLQRHIDKRLNLDEHSDAETKRAASEATKGLAPQIEAALGPERYADYMQATKPGAGQLNRLLIRLDLPLRTATQLDTFQADITQRAQTLRSDPALTPADRDAQLAGLAQEARIQLSNTLGGPRGLDAYNDMKGDWLRALDPKPATP